MVSSHAVIKIKPLHIKNPEVLEFSSFITQFNDTWTPQWRQEFVYGRMDPIAFYGGTDRKLSLGFRVIAESVTEAALNMHKINKLLQYQYPTYEKRTGISSLKAPPYFELNFLNVTNMGVDSVQGYLNSPIVIDPGFGDKTKVQFYDGTGEKLLFSDVTILFSLTVLHRKRVGFYKENQQFNISNYPYNLSVDATHTLEETAATALDAVPIPSAANRREGAGPLRAPAAIEQVAKDATAKTKAKLAAIFARRLKGL